MEERSSLTAVNLDDERPLPGIEWQLAVDRTGRRSSQDGALLRLTPQLRR